MMLLSSRRFGFSHDGGSGFGIGGGGVVEQGYASLIIGCGACASGLLDESFGCGGPTLASELGQSQLSDVLQRTRASNGNSSTITIVREQCQTQIRRRLQQCFKRRRQLSAVSVPSLDIRVLGMKRFVLRPSEYGIFRDGRDVSTAAELRL